LKKVSSLLIRVFKKMINYIQGQKFANLADICFDGVSLNRNFDKKGVIVLYSAMKHYTLAVEYIKRNPQTKFILITHNGDESLERIEIPKNLVKWFSVNVNFQDPKIESIPIGLENDCWFPSIKKIEKIDRARKVNKIKDKLIYLSFNLATNIGERGKLFSIFHKKKWVTAEKTVNGKGFDNYLINLTRHKFCFCPQGNGIDTHRFWECLYLGGIPVVKKEINSNFYAQLPVLFVDNWEIITEEYLNSKYAEIILKKPELDMLDMDYWIAKINKIKKMNQ